MSSFVPEKKETGPRSSTGPKKCTSGGGRKQRKIELVRLELVLKERKHPWLWENAGSDSTGQKKQVLTMGAKEGKEAKGSGKHEHSCNKGGHTGKGEMRLLRVWGKGEDVRNAPPEENSGEKKAWKVSGAEGISGLRSLGHFLKREKLTERGNRQMGKPLTSGLT